ncbi:LamG-like jellyroll fold domain-containing protein [Kibdelosporangium phytohabitans]|uniref:LamG-like jellyroll fold domain-containing protein n=1 Tax=Kibdelosporangium phytohabitans TaxID=860235 RepID=UPI001470540E|nr:LamG-like jellyroll fold domain-containing protein [Kibdelosporangium phytohabitans]MBE1469196.1 hypothetical protein [Kibdelosporangium phytohabitans]
MTADRTEKNQVFAQPDGSFTMEQAVEPVRVRRGDGWADIDTAVRTRPDGRVEPAATVTPTVYSGGGTSAMAEFGTAAERLAVHWPSALPTPRLDGDKVVYPEVMPGVDLEMKTFRQGFGYTVIVKNPEAARNPAVRQLSLPVDGLTVKTGNGVRTAYGADGKAVYQSPSSVVQDSTKDGEPGSRRGLSAVSSADGRIVITPDAGILDDPGAGFPIRIAEQWWPLGQFGWTSVYAQYPTQTYWNGANMGNDTRARSGYSGDWEYPTVTVRSFYHFDLRSMHGKHVLGAELNLLGGYSSTCSDSTFWLAHSGGVSPQTNWNNQPGTGRTQERRESGFGRVGCGPRWVGWDVGSDVHWSNHVQPADHVTFRISGPEGDKYAWRKWDTTSYGQHPKLIVKFNQYPHTPGNLTAAPKPGCTQDPNEPYVSTHQPVLKATVNDPDGGRVSAVFELWDRFGALRRELVVGEHESGSEFQVTTPGDLYRDGSRIAWRVKARDPYGAESGWSQWCDITVDKTAPDRKPEVSSTDYPEGVSSGSPGRSGRFHFSAANLADAAGFRYRVGGQGWKFAPAVNGSATVDIAPMTADPVRLDVTIEDKAGNIGQDNELRPELSNVRKYEIRVNGPTPPTSHWKLDGHHTAIDARDSNGKHPGTFPLGKVSWTKGKAGDALAFRGVENSFVTTTGGPAVDSTASFTVAAWVRLDAHPGTTWRTAVSQDGAHVSRFALQFKGESTQRWAFSMMSNDSTAPRIDSAIATDDRFVPQVGQWTHLAGVYDITDKKIRLYVNGVLAGEQAHDGFWWSEAPNALQIARGKWADNIGDYFPGAIDDVKVYDRALSDIRIDNGPSELDELAQTSSLEAVFAFDENTGTKTSDATGAARTATLDATSWAPGKDGTSGFKFDGHPFEGTNHAATEGPVIRTDDSFTVSAWVKPERFGHGARTVLAQSGTTMSGFYLHYRFGPEDAEPSWNFFTPDVDSAAHVWAWVRSPAKIVEGQWTHLAAVYDESVPELRLYVNGVQSGPPAKLKPRNWTAAGPLQIGRGKYMGRTIDPWVGTIDEVRVHSGVRSAADISAEVAAPLPDRKRLPAHGRYIAHRGDHRGGNGPIPSEYRLEGTVGYYLPPGTPGTHMLYSCITGDHDAFTTAKADCWGSRMIGPLGLAYDNPPAGVRANRLNRCRVKQGSQENFDSLTSDCEGHTVEEELGYLLPYTTLTRYQQTDGDPDRRSDTGNVPVGYRAQRDLVALHYLDGDGRVPLALCRTGADTYVQTGWDCTGKDQQLVERLGWAWPQRPSDPAAKELFACAEVSETRERFESTDSGCEGQDVLGSLGFGIDPARVTR